MAIEAKASRAAHRTDARPLLELLASLRVLGGRRDARPVGLMVTWGREVEPLAGNVWVVPDWRLFGPAAGVGH